MKKQKEGHVVRDGEPSRHVLQSTSGLSDVSKVAGGSEGEESRGDEEERRGEEEISGYCLMVPSGHIHKETITLCFHTLITGAYV